MTLTGSQTKEFLEELGLGKPLELSNERVIIREIYAPIRECLHRDTEGTSTAEKIKELERQLLSLKRLMQGQDMYRLAQAFEESQDGVNDQLTSLHARITRLETQVKETSDDVQSLRKTVEELRKQMAVKATSGDVQDLRKRIEQLQADMGNMASAKIVDALSKGIKKYQQHIDKEMNTTPWEHPAGCFAPESHHTG